MNAEHDVVVVGAGCAGALAGRLLASRGYRVLMLDKARAGDPCHGFHDLVEEDSLIAAGGALEDFSRRCPRPSSLDVLSPDTVTRVSVPESRFRVVNRAELTAHIVEGAREAGAKILYRCAVNGAEIRNGFVRGVSTERGSFPCRLVIGASGPDRVLCRDLPSGMGIPRRLRTSDYISMYRETREPARPAADSPPAGAFRYHLGRYGGYSWTYTGDEGEIDIGTGVQDLPVSPDPREIVLGYVRSNTLVGERVLCREGGRVPTRRPLHTMVTNGMMLVGDEACHSSPVIARGVGGALLGAAIAARAAQSALAAGDVSVAGLWSYNSEYMTRRGAHMAALDCLRVLMQRMPVRDFCWSMAKGVIDEPEISAVLTGRFEVPGAQVRIRSILKGLASVPLMVRYDSTLKIAQRVFEHYMAYPAIYDAADFADWSRGADFLFEDVERA